MWMLGAPPAELRRQGLHPWPKDLWIPSLLGILGGAAVAWIWMFLRPIGVTATKLALGNGAFLGVGLPLTMLVTSFLLLYRQRNGFRSRGISSGQGITEGPEQRFVRTMILTALSSITLGLVLAGAFLNSPAEEPSVAHEVPAAPATERWIARFAVASEVADDGVSPTESLGQTLETLWDTLRLSSTVSAETLAAPGAWNGQGPITTALNECGRCFTGALPHPVHAAPVRIQVVFPGFFDRSGVAIRSGRGFNGTENEEELVAVVSRSYEVAHFQDGGALGRTVSLNGIDGPWHKVVGVVEDTDIRGLGGNAPRNVAYFHGGQHPPSSLDLVLAVPASEDSIAESRPNVESLVAASLVDLPSITIDRVLHVHEERERLEGPISWMGQLSTASGVAAMLMVVAGFAFAIAHNTRHRHQEFAIRKAVGATPKHMRRLLLREALIRSTWIGGLGAWIGLALVSGFSDSGLSAVAPHGLLTAFAATVVITTTATFYGAMNTKPQRRGVRRAG